MAMLNNQRVNDDAEKLQRFFKEMADGQIFSFQEMNIAMFFFWGIPWFFPHFPDTSTRPGKRSHITMERSTMLLMGSHQL